MFALRVAAGLDSMVAGETQILGQVREAYAAAMSAGTAGRLLHDLLQQALRVGKRVHAETGYSHRRDATAWSPPPWRSPRVGWLPTPTAQRMSWRRWRAAGCW